MGRLELASAFGEVLILDEPVHDFGSADNTRVYPVEIGMEGRGRAPNMHGVLLDGRPRAIVAAWGGPLGVHERTAVMLADRLHLAVGDSVFCFALEPFALVWSRKVDTATCFGLHISPDRGALISHGEMEIARLSPEGEILWWRSGEDIFTGPFALRPNFIEAEDFEGGTYRFDYETGADAGGVAGCFDA